MPPAARITDLHTCPIPTHGGGPITGPSVPNVLIGGLPAAVVGDL
ncbi:MAG TPA: PAAR domain-containing protein, partial [Saprospiraceae bacterium]|nr:PAAR domain-containing protein [Saprospiraceae bacterium]